MSTSNKKFENKKMTKNKSNLIITPFFSCQTTANTTNKNTIIVNSRNENINYFDYSDKENSSRNFNNRNDNKGINIKSKKLYLNKNSPRGRNSPLKHFVKNNLVKTNENSYNKDNNLCNKSNDFNSYSSNYNIKKNIKINDLKHKNKSGFILIDQIINNNNHSPSTKSIFKLRNKQIILSEERKKPFSKDKDIKLKKLDNNILNNNKKSNVLSSEKQKNNFNNINKKTVSRNFNLKISSSVKINNSNKVNSISNSINKTQIDKNIYFKKKVEDSSKIINTKKIINLNRKYNMPNQINHSSNHNYLVNLLLEDKKNDKNNNIKLYNMINKKNIKNLEINTKSSFISKYSDILSITSNANNNNLNKKIIPKPAITKNKNNIYSSKESPVKDMSAKFNMNLHNTDNIKKINMKKEKNKNNKLKKYKSMENKSKEKSIDNNKYKSSDKIKSRKKIKKPCLNKMNEKQINKNSKTSNNSILTNKDSFDFLLETITKSKKKENINDIKINNFSIKKPREENMKFTLLKNKDENEETTQEINKSKIIIGNIEGYKDIIESDKINKLLNNENTLFGHNTIDNNLNEESKKRNKLLLLNFKNMEITDKNENTKEGFEICNLNNINKNSFTNDSDIKCFLNCMESDYEFEDMSTTILKKNQMWNNNGRYLLPYHVNKISFIKVYDDNSNNFIINENINNDKVLLADINNISIIKKNKNNKNNEKIDINEMYFKQKDMLINNIQLFDNKNNSKKKKIDNINIIYDKNKENKNIMNYSNKIQNSYNFCIEGNDKKCLIF